MPEYKAVKLSPDDSRRYLLHQRRILQALRSELTTTRNPDAVLRYIDFARLSIICAKRGYTLH